MRVWGREAGIALFALVGIATWALSTAPIGAQETGDISRLEGIVRVQIRADAVWDEEITMSAGGATGDQFRDALSQTFAGTITESDAAPSVVPGAPTTVVCHVDTFYETGQIIYSLRTQVEQPGADGTPVITWIRSWVGNFGIQQMHRMFTLGEQCAERFLEDWKGAN